MPLGPLAIRRNMFLLLLLHVKTVKGSKKLGEFSQVI